MSSSYSNLNNFTYRNGHCVYIGDDIFDHTVTIDLTNSPNQGLVSSRSTQNTGLLSWFDTQRTMSSDDDLSDSESEPDNRRRHTTSDSESDDDTVRLMCSDCLQWFQSFNVNSTQCNRCIVRKGSNVFKCIECSESINNPDSDLLCISCYEKQLERYQGLTSKKQKISESKQQIITIVVPELSTCCVCMVVRSEVVTDPCGHLVMCEKCAKYITELPNRQKRQCPMCRRLIVKYIKVYV
jgi:hypothetical protein